MSVPQAILIAGPTASGKSAFALEQARRVQAAAREPCIVNADSMQVYPVLQVLTARPSRQEMAGVEHRLYGHAPLAAPYSVARWRDDVTALLAELDGRGAVPLFVGGTGLYFRALEQGLAPVPAIDPAIRAQVRGRLEAGGAAALHEELAHADPQGAAALRASDGQRIARALEVVLSTGTPLATHQRAGQPAVLDGWQLEKHIIEPPRAVLHARIAKRAARMLERGAVDEVAALRALDLPAGATALKAIGVAQIGAMLDGLLTPEEALAKLIAATRQYAKRQSTWFRGQMDASWQRHSPENHA